jgi:hypothetical protein
MSTTKTFLVKQLGLFVLCFTIQTFILINFIEEKTIRKVHGELIQYGLLNYDSQTGLFQAKNSTPNPNIIEDFCELDAQVVIPDKQTTTKKR